MKYKILRQQISNRGGGIEIQLPKVYNGKMTCYQNYLGGGLLGSIGNDCTVPDWRSNPKLVKIADNLNKYFHDLTNPETEWESATYNEIQCRPLSAY